MIGIDPATLDGVFAKVPAHRDHRPDLTFDGMEAIGPHARAYAAARFNDGATFREIAHQLPMRALTRLGPDRLAKTRHATFFMMDRSVEEAFAADPALRIMEKIRSSAWRWGVRRPGWNETVDAYEGLRTFDLGIEGLSTTIDFTTSVNPQGHSEHSRTFLDGVFALLVHFRGKHVMTIGFSFAARRRILLQQVQTTSRTGNRWLYRMPANRMEFVVDRLRAAFPRHRVLVADGAQIAARNVASYMEGAATIGRRVGRARDRLEGGHGDPRKTAAEVAEAEAEREEMLARARHLRAETPRLAAFYADCGRHRLGRATVYNGIRHHAVAA